MKKIILFLLLAMFTLSFAYAGGSCLYSNSSDIQSLLKGCLSDTTLINLNGSLKTTDNNFSSKIYKVSKTIATILSLAAVLGIAYGSFLMVTAAGEDEKIKKGKDVIKWSIIGFLGVVLASSLIVLITKFIFDLKS